ncbi:MAG: plastocyanin/azurin family copper-binding protein [Oligoflexales bacterium]
MLQFKMKYYSILFVIFSLSESAFSDDKNVSINLSTKGNNIAFDTEKIKIKLGQGLRIKFKNLAFKDSGIFHNIAILKPGTLDEVLTYFEANDYDQKKVSEHKAVIAITPMLNPNQEQEVVVKPSQLSKPGEYPYVCLVPGHADMLGMKGVLVVEP